MYFRLTRQTEFGLLNLAYNFAILQSPKINGTVPTELGNMAAIGGLSISFPASLFVFSFVFFYSWFLVNGFLLIL
jgi:hypothetical protein